MPAKPTLDDHIKWQLDRAYTGYYEDVDPMDYAKKFQSSPSEASSILDCQTLNLIKVENIFDRVFDIPGFNPITVMDVLKLTHQDHEALSMHFMGAVLANETIMELGKDSVCQVFKIQNGLMILRTSTPLQADSNGHVIYVLDQFKDVSDLVTDGKFSWSFKGPSAERFAKLVERSMELDCPLSTQELTVLSFVGKGLSSKEAADKLFLSKHTIDTHRRNILKKLDAENTVIAYQKAKHMGIIA